MSIRNVCTAIFCLLPLSAIGAENSLDPMRSALEAAIARVRPAVVRIEVVWVSYDQGREVKQEASGSGFIITSKGYVVTNHHVAGRATRAMCVFANNEEIEARLVGTDPMTDIAVLKLDQASHEEFPTVSWGDSGAVSVGDTVLAMGSPLALSQSVTRGIVSNAKMTMPGGPRRFGRVSMEGEDVGSLVRWIAHDAAIYPGNSGGPLVDMSGNVIGVNEISMGLGGAIPSSIARDVAQQIIATGHVTRGWLGIETQPLLKGAGVVRGALLSDVIADSPAALAGLRAGDILLRLDDHEVSGRFDEELPLLNLAVAAIPVGKEVVAVVLRNGKETEIRVRAIEQERSEFRQQELRSWGMTAKNISFLTAKEMRLDNREGALVTSTRAGGPSGAAKPPLQFGDVITRVAGHPVRNVADLSALTGDLARAGQAPVPVAVEFGRHSEQFLTVVRIGIRDAADPGAEASRAWLPAAVQVVTREMAEQLAIPGKTGVRVTEVYPGSTAAAAGLQVGDLVLAIDGEAIPASQPGDEEVFATMIRQHRVGDKSELSLARAGQPLKLTVALARSPKLEREMGKYQDRDFEFSARDLSFFDRVREELREDISGTLVTEVKDGGWAALGGLQVNDIVSAIDGDAIADVGALGAKMTARRRAQAKFVVFRVLRGTHRRQIEMQANWHGDN